jgi:hypothetical protein
MFFIINNTFSSILFILFIFKIIDESFDRQEKYYRLVEKTIRTYYNNLNEYLDNLKVNQISCF